MKQLYNLEFTLIAFLIVASTSTFAQIRDYSNVNRVFTTVKASNPRSPAKISNTKMTYGFAKTVGAFSSINGSGTIATGVVGDDQTQLSIPLGFTFNFYGVSYTKVAACTNGWLSFNPSIYSAAQLSGDLASPGTGDNIFPFAAPLFGDLQVGSHVYYQTGGGTGNHTFTIEWDGVAGSYYGTNNSTDSCMSFQVILYESTGEIQFVYLSGPTALDCAGHGPSVGLRDADTSFIYITDLTNTTSTKVDSGTLNSGTSTTVLSTTPPAGLTFTFTPTSGAALPVQSTNFLATAGVGSVTLSWQTETEVNNAGFNILRRGVNESSFSLISNFNQDSRLRGYGTSTIPRSYSFTDHSVASGALYWYKIQSVTTSGVTEDVKTLSVTTDVPNAYSLGQNYPNPFNPTTTVRFDLSQPSTVTLEVYNVLGQKVVDVNKGMMAAGRYNQDLDLSRNASGVYFYRLTAVGTNGERFVSMKKMMLIK